MIRVSSFVFFIFVFSLLMAQNDDSVALCSDWVATVDEQSQRIVLRWRPSPDSTVMGYHICTGSPCWNYDTVFGRLDTSYICLDHSPLERHIYKLHVFDSSYNVSQLTPPFGNMVLTADIPECESNVDVSWTPYDSMPGGLGGYRLMAKFEPIDTAFVLVGSFGADDLREHSVDLPDAVTTVHFKVLAFNTTGTIVSQSNIVSAERRTARTACCNSITSIWYDSVRNSVNLELYVDTAFRHTLWRSIDGSPWQFLDTVRSATTETVYCDTRINRYDSLHCYQLSVSDECGLNERFSLTVWTTVPDPPPTGIAIPNVIIAGSETNGAFRPMVLSLMGDIYELSIYNRNGLLVFHTEDPHESWLPSNETPQGIYTYHLRIRYLNNKIHTYVGTVLLIK